MLYLFYRICHLPDEVVLESFPNIDLSVTWSKKRGETDNIIIVFCQKYISGEYSLCLFSHKFMSKDERNLAIF